jgi:hypothetical protein
MLNPADKREVAKLWRSRYEVANYPLKVPDLPQAVNRSFNDAIRLMKKHLKEKRHSNPKKFERMIYRLNHLRHEVTTEFKIE